MNIAAFQTQTFPEPYRISKFSSRGELKEANIPVVSGSTTGKAEVTWSCTLAPRSEHASAKFLYKLEARSSVLKNSVPRSPKAFVHATFSGVVAGKTISRAKNTGECMEQGCSLHDTVPAKHHWFHKVEKAAKQLTPVPRAAGRAIHTVAAALPMAPDLSHVCRFLIRRTSQLL